MANLIYSVLLGLLTLALGGGCLLLCVKVVFRINTTGSTITSIWPRIGAFVLAVALAFVTYLSGKQTIAFGKAYNEYTKAKTADADTGTDSTDADNTDSADNQSTDDATPAEESAEDTTYSSGLLVPTGEEGENGEEKAIDAEGEYFPAIDFSKINTDALYSQYYGYMSYESQPLMKRWRTALTKYDDAVGFPFVFDPTVVEERIGLERTGASAATYDENVAKLQMTDKERAQLLKDLPQIKKNAQKEFNGLTKEEQEVYAYDRIFTAFFNNAQVQDEVMDMVASTEYFLKNNEQWILEDKEYLDGAWAGDDGFTALIQYAEGHANDPAYFELNDDSKKIAGHLAYLFSSATYEGKVKDRSVRNWHIPPEQPADNFTRIVENDEQEDDSNYWYVFRFTNKTTGVQLRVGFNAKDFHLGILGLEQYKEPKKEQPKEGKIPQDNDKPDDRPIDDPKPDDPDPTPTIIDKGEGKAVVQWVVRSTGKVLDKKTVTIKVGKSQTFAAPKELQGYVRESKTPATWTAHITIKGQVARYTFYYKAKGGGTDKPRDDEPKDGEGAKNDKNSTNHDQSKDKGRGHNDSKGTGTEDNHESKDETYTDYIPAKETEEETEEEEKREDEKNAEKNAGTTSSSTVDSNIPDNKPITKETTKATTDKTEKVTKPDGTETTITVPVDVSSEENNGTVSDD